MLAKKSGWPASRSAPALGMQRFQEVLAGTARLDRAIALFDQAVATGGATGHQCSRLVLEQYAVPLFGNAAHHAARISKLAQSGAWDMENPLLLPMEEDASDAIMVIPIPLLTNDPLVVSIGYEESDAHALDLQLRASLHGLSIIYAHRALTLWEIEEDIETVTPLTLKERLTFALLLCGYPQFEIAIELDCSMTAVSAFIASATNKLKTPDIAAAVALSARRGWLHLPHELMKHQRGIDS